MSSAMFNRNFFDSLKDNLQSPWGGSWFASTPYIVGLEGEVVQTMPDEEVHWHAGSETYTPLAEKYISDLTGFGPNKSTIGVELCHPDLTGQFRNATIDAAIKLFSDVMYKYGIDSLRIFSHHDIVGWKDCPRWFVNHPEEFDDFKKDVAINLRRMYETKAKEGSSMRFPIHRIHGTRHCASMSRGRRKD